MGEEEYYLKILWYIATKRRLPKQNVQDCYERLKAESSRFVEIYIKRGGRFPYLLNTLLLHMTTGTT